MQIYNDTTFPSSTRAFYIVSKNLFEMKRDCNFFIFLWLWNFYEDNDYVKYQITGM